MDVSQPEVVVPIAGYAVILITVLWCSALMGAGIWLYLSYTLEVTRRPPWWAHVLGSLPHEFFISVAQLLSKSGR